MKKELLLLDILTGVANELCFTSNELAVLKNAADILESHGEHSCSYNIMNIINKSGCSTSTSVPSTRTLSTSETMIKVEKFIKDKATYIRSNGRYEIYSEYLQWFVEVRSNQILIYSRNFNDEADGVITINGCHISSYKYEKDLRNSRLLSLKKLLNEIAEYVISL